MKAYCEICKELTEQNEKPDLYSKILCSQCSNVNYKVLLIRLNDGLINHSYKVNFVEFENGQGKALHSKPSIGYSCLLGSVNSSYDWLTTEITEILVDKEHYLHFKTKNSSYELYY